jgi:MerR family transcriptional regulator, copper efflux regulator
MSDKEDHAEAQGGGMRIGELAQQSGVPAKTIRFYEESAVLPAPPRSVNGYREYNEEDVKRLRFVRNARELDFSLDELREVLGLRERGQAPCHHVLALLDEKLVALEERIGRLQELRAELNELRRYGAELPTDDVQMERCVCHLIGSR